MTGLWSVSGVPHKGWVDLGVLDEDQPNHVCEMCEVAHVRFVHVMRHVEHPVDLRVGCACAEKMSEDYVTPKLHERNAKNRQTRREKWLTRKWKISKKGNEYLRHQGSVLTIFLQPEGWNYGARSDGTPGSFGPGHFKSNEAAKLGLFDALWPPLLVKPRLR